MTRTERSFMDKFWEDKHGRLVIWQKPNIFLIVGIASLFMQVLFGAGGISDFSRIVGSISFAIWAVLEIGWGASYFRRVLGFCVLAFMVLLHV